MGVGCAIPFNLEFSNLGVAHIQAPKRPRLGAGRDMPREACVLEPSQLVGSFREIKVGRCVALCLRS